MRCRRRTLLLRRRAASQGASHRRNRVAGIERGARLHQATSGQNPPAQAARPPSRSAPFRSGGTSVQIARHDRGRVAGPAISSSPIILRLGNAGEADLGSHIAPLGRLPRPDTDHRAAEMGEMVGFSRQVGGLNKLPIWVLCRQFGFQIRWGMPHLI